ncbi:hypothetical protein [Hafnia paralvei]|uniref:hypothetical protein n=1 Tax=Hafnia paralvei TaxID=546367 RepID=UPI0018F104D3|nr:hypothetical protein [Hafnia paralvei]MBW2957105.1 hypothetical protein [Hafnia paralvei]MCQ4169272.1 hypothetical protein [Hafnia paralvei]MDX6841602.1 hypothetical protein [Hafnia paralvei]
MSNSRYPVYDGNISELNNIQNSFVSMSKTCLEINTKTVSEGILMSRFFLPILIFIYILIVNIGITKWAEENSILDIALELMAVFSFTTLMRVFIVQINKNSNVVFNRHTKKCYAYYAGKKHISNIDDVVISGGAKTIISLNYTNKHGVDIMNSIEIDDQWNVKPISYYIKKFLYDGPSDLPIPISQKWEGVEINNVAFSPIKSLRHYAPWPFCGKTVDPLEKMLKIYMWPIYTFIIFPINMIFSLLWYPFTKIFNIKPHPVPEEAYEGDDSIRVTPEMAAKGIRP